MRTLFSLFLCEYIENISYLADGTKHTAFNASGEGVLYLGSLVYRRHLGSYALESAAFDAGRFVAAVTSSGTIYRPHYFITDHLGSVRTVVDAGGEVLERNDYYPFGLRWSNSAAPISDNRYRYNGKEEQAFVDVPYIDYGARMYDPAYRMSWFALDPLAEKYLSVNPYAFCSNNPIKYIDPDGCKLLFASGVSEQFKSQFEKTIRFMNEHGTSMDIAKLHASETIYYIKEGDSEFDPNNNTILWHPQQIVKTDKCILFPATILAHESKHALQKEENSRLEFLKKAQYDNTNKYGNRLEEEVITTTEQDVARKHGDIQDGEVTRTSHKGQIIEFAQPLPEGKILEDFRTQITLRYK